MTTTSSHLVLDDALQIALSGMIRHFEKSVSDLHERGIEQSDLYIYAVGVRQIKEMLHKNLEITSTSSFNNSTITLRLD
jgi:hypothetical protein